MTTSVREAVLAKFKTVLLAATQTPAGANVYRSRLEALTSSMLPAIIVRPGQNDIPNEDTNGKVNREFDVEILVLTEGDVPDSLADPTIISAHAKIMADRTLGGLAIDIYEGRTSWRFDQAEKDSVEVSILYVVRYRTSATDLTQ
jgi:hypothetical protein